MAKKYIKNFSFGISKEQSDFLEKESQKLGLSMGDIIRLRIFKPEEKL